MSWWLLAILYGLAGFGYIIVATYLPLMAKDAGSPLLTAHLWTLVGLSIVPGCFGWLWAAKRWGALPCLTANLLVQAISVLLTLASDSPLLLIISSLGFGGTFMGTTSLVMTIARQLSVQSFRLCDAHLRHWANSWPGADQYAWQWNIGACQRHSLRRGGVVYCCAYQHSAII